MKGWQRSRKVSLSSSRLLTRVRFRFSIRAYICASIYSHAKTNATLEHQTRASADFPVEKYICYIRGPRFRKKYVGYIRQSKPTSALAPFQKTPLLVSPRIFSLSLSLSLALSRGVGLFPSAPQPRVSFASRGSQQNPPEVRMGEGLRVTGNDSADEARGPLCGALCRRDDLNLKSIRAIPTRKRDRERHRDRESESQLFVFNVMRE